MHLLTIFRLSCSFAILVKELKTASKLLKDSEKEWEVSGSLHLQVMIIYEAVHFFNDCINIYIHFSQSICKVMMFVNALVNSPDQKEERVKYENYIC